MLQKSLNRYSDTTILKTNHALIDQHYPLNRERNLMDMDFTAMMYRAPIIDSKYDRGAADGFNNAMKVLFLNGTDLVITYDPDSWPKQEGWDFAMYEVLRKDPQISYVSLRTPEKINGEQREAYGYNYIVTDRPFIFGVTMWRWSFLNRVGGLHQRQKYYGHVEAEMFSRLGDTKNAYLTDYYEDSLVTMQDPQYQNYKVAHAINDKNPFTGSFEEYLKQGGI